MHDSVLAVSFVLFSACASVHAQTTSLDFNNPLPGTLMDSAGRGVGLTHRLPGTGASLAVHDQNWVLGGGVLAITSTQANIQQQAALDVLEAPCVLWSGPAAQDLRITARMLQVVLPNSSDQMGIVIGIAADQNVRFVAHQTNQIYVQERVPSGSNTGFTVSSASGVYAAGSSLSFTITRLAGLWYFDWQVDGTSLGGTFGPVSLPWSDSAPTLHIGLIASNVYTPTSFVALFDSFEVNSMLPAAASAFGSGCPGSSGVPTVTPSNLPVLGSVFSITGSNLPSPGTNLAIGFFGFSRTNWGFYTLPFDLAGQGLPGCSLLVAPPPPGIILGAFTANGQCTWTQAVPNAGYLGGVELFFQALIPDAQAGNPLGASVTNGVQARIGW